MVFKRPQFDLFNIIVHWHQLHTCDVGAISLRTKATRITASFRPKNAIVAQTEATYIIALCRSCEQDSNSLVEEEYTLYSNRQRRRKLGTTTGLTAKACAFTNGATCFSCS